MKKSLFSLFIIACVAVGCSDDDREPLPFERQVELLAGRKDESKTWTLVSLVVNGTPAPILECDNDNTVTFYNNSLQQYKITSNTEKCETTEPEVLEEGSWAFSVDGNTVIISGSKVFAYKQMNYFGLVTAKPGKVLELTETSFVTEINVVDGVDFDAANVVITLKSM
jgi:hypothetical protein